MEPIVKCFKNHVNDSVSKYADVLDVGKNFQASLTLHLDYNQGLLP